MAKITQHPDLHADVTLTSGDRLSLTLAHVGVNGQGYDVWCPPYPVDARLIVSVHLDHVPARASIDFSRGHA